MVYLPLVRNPLTATLLDLLLENERVYRELLPVLNERVLVPVSRALRFRRRQSALAHKWLDGRRGVEIGPSEMNTFGLSTLSVGRRDKIYEREQLERVGCFSPIHIEADADRIPLPDGSQDFVFTSHVIEHCVDFIRALVEWVRILRIDGILFTIVPQRDAAPSDVGRPLTTWEHVLDDYRRRITEADDADAGVPGHCHYHVFAPETAKDFIERIFGDALVLVDEQRVDDKIGNGFTLVYRKKAAFSGLGQHD